MTESLADFVVSVKDGRIMSQGSLNAALLNVGPLIEGVEEKVANLREGEEKEEGSLPLANGAKPDSDGKLIVAEEVQFGRVTLVVEVSPKTAVCK